MSRRARRRQPRGAQALRSETRRGAGPARARSSGWSRRRSRTAGPRAVDLLAAVQCGAAEHRRLRPRKGAARLSTRVGADERPTRTPFAERDCEDPLPHIRALRSNARFLVGKRGPSARVCTRGSATRRVDTPGPLCFASRPRTGPIHEANLSAEPHPPRTHARLPRTDEQSRRKKRALATAGEGTAPPRPDQQEEVEPVAR